MLDALIEHLTEIKTMAPVIISASGKILSALAIFVVGWMIARWVRKRLRTTRFGGRAIDVTIRPVVAGSAFMC